MDLDREIDAELRQLFTSDDRLDVPLRADAEDVIVAGARRVRQRRIVAATASGAAAVVAMVAAGVVLASGGPDAMPPATINPTVPPETSVSSGAAVGAPVGTPPGQAPSASGGITVPRTTTPTKKKTTTTTTVPSDPAPPDLEFQTLGPTGFRAVKLGQTVEEAQASGLLGPPSSEAEGGCTSYELLIGDGVTGYVLASETVQVIGVDPAQTPEGVGPGWTVEQVKAVYADLDEAAATAGGQVVVPVPGNATAEYRLEFTGGEVTGVTLQAAGQTCS